MEPRTDADRFIVEQLQPVLRANERILVCAYLVPVIRSTGVWAFVSAATSSAALAAITSERLLLIECRIGAFQPVLENRGVVSLERAEVKGADTGSGLVLDLADGRMLEYQDNRASTHVSTQTEFFARVESTFGHSEQAARKTRDQRWLSWIATAVGIALAILYALYLSRGR